MRPVRVSPRRPVWASNAPVWARSGAGWQIRAKILRRRSRGIAQCNSAVESSFGCCLRMDDVDTFYRLCVEAGLPEATTGFPGFIRRASKSQACASARSTDPDGTLLRLIGNP